jgi:hypothetical protein
MKSRSFILATGLVAVALALGGCGVSVAFGGQDAAARPASGIWVSPTVGAADISGVTGSTVPYRLPPSTPPALLPSGLSATVAVVESAVTGGCWQDAHQGNVYGAYDQLFWWQGQCGDTVGQVTVELFPTVAAANSAAHHAAASELLVRDQAGAVLVDVYASAPQIVISQLSSVKGLKPIPGYGG